MRVYTLLVAAGLAAATTGCIETMDSGYGGYNRYSGYSDPYYSTYGYSQPTYRSTNNYYYQPAPTVVRETRYVTVPQPHQHTTHHRWEGRRDGNHDHNTRRETRHRDEDRDGDGKPDRWTRGRRS
jgi:hypothetical protein